MSVFSQTFERVTPKKFSIESNFWSPKVKELLVNFLPMTIDLLENDRDGWHSIQNFREAAKKNQGKPYIVPIPEPGKKKIWSDGPVYNTFEAMCWALTIDAGGDTTIINAQKLFQNKINNWIPIFLNAMEEDGYLCPQATICNYKRWDNPAGLNLHEDYMLGYFLECAMAHHNATGDTRMLQAARKSADLWCRSIGYPPKLPFQTCHPGLKQSLVRFAEYMETIDGAATSRKYLELAIYLSDERGKQPYPETNLDAWTRTYVLKDEPNMKVTQLHGHAVMGVYLLSGMIEITRSLDKMYANNPDYAHKRFLEYDNTVEILWNNLVNRKMYVNGTIGSSGKEEYHADYDLPDYSYGETCASIGNLLVQNNMGLLHGYSKYHDVAELTLYNGILGSLDEHCKNWAYCNPLINIKDKTWRDNWERKHHTEDCCMNNISRTLLQLPVYMYAKSDSSIRINQFIGSTFTITKVGGTNVTVKQKTNYPNDGKIELTFFPEQSSNFEVLVRIPDRQVSSLYQPVQMVRGYISIKLNGKVITPVMYKGYAVIKRNWSSGDKIELEIPVEVQKIHTIEKIDDKKGKIALQRGPIVYVVEKKDVENQDPTQINLKKNSVLKTSFAKDLVGGIWTITGQLENGKSFIAVPFYARMNREIPGKYAVWMNEK